MAARRMLMNGYSVYGRRPNSAYPDSFVMSNPAATTREPTGLRGGRYCACLSITLNMGF